MSKQGIAAALVASCIAMAGTALSGGGAMAGDQQQNSSGAAGMKVYVDPTTGKILEAPAPNVPSGALVLSPAEQNAVSTSDQGLVPVPNTGSAGGEKANLGGRFRSPLIATVGPDGKRTLQHIEIPAPTSPTK